VAGDVFTTTQYPFIDTANGGSIQGEIQALNFILDRTVYVHDEDGGTLIIPGHGRVTDEWEVAEYRDGGMDRVRHDVVVYTREQPMTALLIAAGAGIVLGWLSAGRR